jgi:hypothetical protein
MTRFELTWLSSPKAWEITKLKIGRDTAQAISGRHPTTVARVSSTGHVGFVAHKVVPGQAFSEFVGFPCQFSFHRLLHMYHLSSEAGTIGQLVLDVPSELSLDSSQEKYKFIYMHA